MTRPLTGPDGDNPITDEQIRELRGCPTEVHARAQRKAAETRAGRKRNATVDHAFAFFGSTDVEQAARSSAVSRAEVECARAMAAAVARYRARCAAVWNARHGAR